MSKKQKRFANLAEIEERYKRLVDFENNLLLEKDFYAKRQLKLLILESIDIAEYKLMDKRLGNSSISILQRRITEWNELMLEIENNDVKYRTMPSHIQKAPNTKSQIPFNSRQMPKPEPIRSPTRILSIKMKLKPLLHPSETRLFKLSKLPARAPNNLKT